MKFQTIKKKTQPLAYQYYYYPACFLVLSGVFDSLYLAYSHYQNYTDITHASFCAISKAINCDTVSQSPWSLMFGLPLAVWGLFAYLIFACILFSARRQSLEKISLWAILLFLGIIYSLYSVYLGYVSATKIHSYCLMCLISYLISFLLMFYALIIRSRFDSRSFLDSLNCALVFLKNSFFLKSSLAVLLIILLSLKLFMPHYWDYDFPVISGEISSGLTKEGHPWIGSEHADLVIEEFSDYQCFQCYKLHYMLRRLIVEHPGKIKLIHRHYPMDHEFNSIVVPEPFHVGSGKMALMAIYAATQGKFWEMNDTLFKTGRTKQPFNSKQIEQDTGIKSGELVEATKHAGLRSLLQSDIREGMKLIITGTPTFLIDGQTYQGAVPEKIFKDIPL